VAVRRFLRSSGSFKEFREFQGVLSPLRYESVASRRAQGVKKLKRIGELKGFWGSEGVI